MTDDGRGEGSAIRREFWLLVGIVNAGVLGASLGVMLLALTDRTLAGAALAVAGLAALAYAGLRYRARPV